MAVKILRCIGSGTVNQDIVAAIEGFNAAENIVISETDGKTLTPIGVCSEPVTWPDLASANFIRPRAPSPRQASASSPPTPR